MWQVIIKLCTNERFKPRLTNLGLRIQIYLPFLYIFLLQQDTLKFFSLIHRHFLQNYGGRVALQWHPSRQFQFVNMVSFLSNVFLPIPIKVVKLFHINDWGLFVKWREISLGSVVICYCHHWLQAYKSCLLFSVARFSWLSQA